MYTVIGIKEYDTPVVRIDFVYTVIEIKEYDTPVVRIHLVVYILLSGLFYFNAMSNKDSPRFDCPILIRHGLRMQS